MIFYTGEELTLPVRHAGLFFSRFDMKTKTTAARLTLSIADSIPAPPTIGISLYKIIYFLKRELKLNPIVAMYLYRFKIMHCKTTRWPVVVKIGLSINSATCCQVGYPTYLSLQIVNPTQTILIRTHRSHRGSSGDL
jgi:hypothetical protein